MATQPPIVRAMALAGVSRAFRPQPLTAAEIPQFFSVQLSDKRSRNLQRNLSEDLLDCAQSGFFFHGCIYGNRGTGKSTEINRLLADPSITSTFAIVRLDATNELNPQTFSVADVLILLLTNLIEACRAGAEARGRAFHESYNMVSELQTHLAAFFPELQNRIQQAQTTGANVELNLLQFIKGGLRVEGQRKTDLVNQRESLTSLKDALDRLIDAARVHFGQREILIVGENFDKESIPRKLLEDTFIEYASVLKDFRLHLLFTLPVPLVYSAGPQLAFRQQQRYAIYDVPVTTHDHQPHADGCQALKDMLERRVDTQSVFDPTALDLLLRASGGDLYLLFALIAKAARLARFRHEDQPATEPKVLVAEARSAALEQLSIFRNELGSAPGDPDPLPWADQLQKLRDVYEGKPAAGVPDTVLYRLIRRRAILYFNGSGRYAVHPLAVEVLKEQLAADATFKYQGGGLDLQP